MTVSEYEFFEGAFRDQEAAKAETTSLLRKFISEIESVSDFQVEHLAELALDLRRIAISYPILDTLDEGGEPYDAAAHFDDSIVEYRS